MMKNYYYTFFVVLGLFINCEKSNAQYIISGNAAATGNNCYQLTPNALTQVGSVWNASLINLNDPFDFLFSVFLGCDDNGADGICFGLQPISTSVGVNGNGMGLGGIAPSLGVYIDTYQNSMPDNDPAYDHISLNANGDVNHLSANNLAGPVQANSTNGNIEDCINHQLRVKWDPVSQTYTVWFDGILRFTYTGNIIANIFGGNPNVYWGFTGSTGGLSNLQSFCILTFTNFSYNSTCYNLPIQFTDMSFSGTPITNWTWNFGDGSPTISGSGAAFQNPSHLYAAPGTYTVTMTILNTGGATSVATNNVVVLAPPPITATGGTTICAGQSVNLTGTNGPNYNAPLSFTSNAANSNLPIQDNTVLTGWTGNNVGIFTTSNIAVSGLQPGWSFASVTLNITHSYDADLTIYLFDPCGNSIRLINSNGGSGDNFTNTTFAPTAVTAIGAGTAPFNGTFIPSAGMATFNTWIANGQACAGANGTWFIRVGDHAGGDVGTLLNWTLNFNNSVPPVFAWSPTATMVNSTTLNPTVTPTVTTTYTITSTNGNGCISSANTTVTVVNGTPVTVNSPTICAGTVATLTANGSTGYTWATGVTSTGLNTASASPNVTTTYTVAGTSGCVAPTTFTVTVSPSLTIAVNSPTICSGTAALLNASGAATYTWQSGINSTGVTTATVSPNTTTTYTVNGVSGVCSGNTTFTVNVNPLPIVTVTDATICNGQTALLTASGATSYTWSNGATSLTVNTANAAPTTTTTFTATGNSLGCTSTGTGTVNVIQIPVLSVNSPSICDGATANLTASGASTFTWSTGATSTGLTTANASPLATTTYTITETSSGCSATTTSTVTVLPLVVVSVNSPTICSGATATLTATGASTYTWASSVTSTGTSTATASPNTTTTYTVNGLTGFCNGVASFTVNVNPLPLVTLSNVTICDGQTALLTAGGATSYTWSNGATALAINTANAAPTTTTNYTVTGITLGCTSTATANVVVNANPTVNVNSPSICYGATASLLATGASTYVWSTGANGTGGNNNNATATPTNTSTYTVTGTTSGCTGTAQATVTVAPQILLSFNSPTICNGASALLTVNGANSYLWSTGATTSQISESPSATSSYSVAGTVDNCTVSGTGTVIVNPIPTVTVSSITICTGQSANLTANGATTYLWSNGATTNPMIDTPTGSTTYSVAGTSLGCTGTTTVNVTVNSGVIVTVTSATICSGTSTILSANGANTYSWSSGASAIPGTGNASVSPLTTTNYTVTGNVAGCIGTAVANVLVNPSPHASFYAPAHTTVVSPSVHFTDYSSSATQWTWNFGDNLNPTTNTSTEQNPTHIYSDIGYYCVKLVTTNAFCADSITSCIWIDPEFVLYIPNAFTPNDGNGTNDEFYPKGQYIKEYSMRIYDRWGNTIFTSDELNKHWNGKANGGSEVAQSDVYVYVITVKDVNDINHKVIGNVTLIR
jgi:gliding motility-associated-like protein